MYLIKRTTSFQRGRKERLNSVSVQKLLMKNFVKVSFLNQAHLL